MLNYFQNKAKKNPLCICVVVLRIELLISSKQLKLFSILLLLYQPPYQQRNQQQITKQG